MTYALSLKNQENTAISTEPPYLKTLNPAQREAVETLEGSVLVLAGAGTGKTRVLTTRIAHLIHTKKVNPSQILAVTFTNKAAREMRERVETLLGYAVDNLWMGTFHSLCARILRKHAELVDLKPDFTILDADDQTRLLKQISKAEDIDEKKYPPRLLLSLISRWKDQALTPDKVMVDQKASFHKKDIPIRIYELYQQRLKILNAVDFGDLLMLCVHLFAHNPDVLKFYQHLFQYILVDEYQDTNVVQYLWLRLLAQGSGNICCVGDEDQSIYGWRGAEITNILRFEKDFPGAKIVRLEQNYRSTEHILGAASSLIGNNKARLGKKLWTEESGGDKIKVTGVWDGAEEVRLIASEIEALQKQGHSLSSMVILVRATFQTREFEERFLTLGIPYRVVGGQRFYERQEIRDAIAYLRVVAQSSDSLAFERIINTPRRGIGASTVQALHIIARNANISLIQAAWDLIQSDEIRGKTKTALTHLLESIERWRSHIPTMEPSDLTGIILEESGYTDMWRHDKSLDASGRLENLKELVTALREYDSLPEFLEHVSLVTETEDGSQNEVVTLMTLHSAKGLEFDHVFLAGWEEDLFPHARALEEDGQSGLEEERRLAYVGLTRARKRVFITHASSRQVHGNWETRLPSRFIEELPTDHVDIESIFSNSYSHSPWRKTGKANYSMQSYGKKNYALRESGAFITDSTFYPIGSRVFHQKFGYGIVEAIDDNKLLVNFDFSGLKKVLANFVKKG